jgi:hypothetical protein
MNDLMKLLETPYDQRDHEWEERFFVSFTKSQVTMLSPDPQEGPDGWPYLMTETSPASKESVQQVFGWLATRGIGLVVNPNKEYPDFVFTYGMIWHFRETGYFYMKQNEVVTGQIDLKEGQRIMTGEPTNRYLPGYVRKILRDFFRDQGLHAVKILMVSEDGEHFDLSFSTESLGNPPEKEKAGIAEAISWFLPPHYSILLTSEKGLPEFIAL